MDLVAETRRHLNLPADSDDPAHGMSVSATFVIDDVHFELVHTAHGPASGPRFLLQCRFGTVTHDTSPEVLRDVLAKNHELARIQMGNYGLDEESDALVFNVFQPMPGLEAHLFADAMEQISAVAHQWREARLASIH